MDPVAVYAEDDGRFRAKTGSYGLAPQGYELEVVVAGDGDAATVTATADYVLFGRWSLAPKPDRYAELFGAHLERAVADDARPTGAKRVDDVDELDGMALPSGRVVPLVVPIVTVLGLAVLLGTAPTTVGEGGRLLTLVGLVLVVAVQIRELRARRGEVARRPNSSSG
jgi:hypothetical protein